ncbi:MAG: DUF2149 domain-containing protein [Clostridiales Family XIII bacterium]|jgi:hypothetical protein|nr:DUF2149 domain-containing protein [Clostridiales Family XIII bacterium]
MLRGGGLRRGKSLLDDDINPMDGAVNIVDAMLVFACGLMLSLVIYWNVDLEENRLASVEQGGDVTEVESVQDAVTEDADGDTRYERMGSVYRDPDTGKLYMVRNDGTEE